MTHTPRTRPDMAEILENLNAPQMKADRWIDQQPMIDRVLFYAVFVAMIFGGVSLIGVGLLRWHQ